MLDLLRAYTDSETTEPTRYVTSRDIASRFALTTFRPSAKFPA